MRHILLILCLSLTLFTSCSKNKNAGNSNSLHLSLAGEISTLDPVNAYDTISNMVIYQGLEQLYQYHYLKRPYQIIPSLAESLPQVSEDKLTYTIKIKKGVRYHDHPAFKGQPRYLKAQDFITQIKRLAFLPLKSNGWWLVDGKIEGINQFRKLVGRSFEKFKSANISGLKALDDHTLQIKLLRPYPQMLYALTMAFTSPVPMEVAEHTGNDLSNTLVGTGPFKLINWTRLSSVKMAKFENYRSELFPSEGDRYSYTKKLIEDAGKKLPFLDEINFHVIKETQTRWLSFKARKIHVLDIPKETFSLAITPEGDLKEEFSKDGIQVQTAPTLTYWWLGFNMNDEVVGKNKNLRLAIAHAINVDHYIEIFTNRIGQKANSIYPPGINGYRPEYELPYKYDLEKAKEYLAKAGFPEGKGLPSIRYDVRGTSATNRQQALYIKSQLAKIGIKVVTKLNTFPHFLDLAKKGELQMWQDGWAMDYPDAENILQLLISKNHPPGPNSTYYNNPKVDQLFDKLKTVEQGPESAQILHQIEDMVHQDIPWIMKFYSRDYVLYHPEVKNYRHSSIIYNAVKYYKLD